MGKVNILKTKSFEFAIKVIDLYRDLRKEHKEFVISQQVVRCGTSIGALLREAEYAESLKDFMHKLCISLKEANECTYWLELLFKTEYIKVDRYNSLINDINEIIKMLISSIKTIKVKLKVRE